MSHDATPTKPPALEPTSRAVPQLADLRRSEAGLRLLLDSTGEAISCTDRDGNITFCN